ncbi:MAG: pantetheine-phosphate adenylyltransferase [Bacteroidaceae bacterium]|nr:pantetheine-phosphate adenylyltransferase [Bacteroidaceae bacterium]
MNIALFSGSFDPFTIGHADIVKRFLPLFDKIVIGVGYNEHKPSAMLTPDERVQQIAAIYKDEPKVEVEKYSDMTVDFASRVGARYIIKGVRSTKDFEYEREQAEINKLLAPEIETIVLFASPEKAAISSSMVRELKHFGRDISKFLP